MLVIGAGPSGLDLTLHISTVADYVSVYYIKFRDVIGRIFLGSTKPSLTRTNQNPVSIKRRNQARR